MGLRVCVFCGSKDGADSTFKSMAYALGQGLAERGMTLVYGGGRVGMMGAVADGAVDAGGKVIGVIPTFLLEWEVGNDRCTQLIETENMHTRKRYMFDHSDVFVTLPGGLGSIDETIEILTWKQLRQHDKPIVVLNQGGYWQPLLDLLSATVAGGYTAAENLAMFDTAESIDALWPILEAVQPTAGVAPETL